MNRCYRYNFVIMRLLCDFHFSPTVYVYQVYAVASEDMDSLTFGAPRFLRHLMDPSSKKVPVMEFEVSKVRKKIEHLGSMVIQIG